MLPIRVGNLFFIELSLSVASCQLRQLYEIQFIKASFYVTDKGW